MRYAVRWIPLTIAVLMLNACAYRVAGPPQLGESLRVTISSNQSRLVRSQALIQQAVGRVIQQRLGWSISPDGGSQLDIAIDREDISVAARTTDGSPSRWKIILKATVTIQSDLRNPAQRAQSFSGIGYANDRLDEPAGLTAAANSLAAKITDWLEHSTADWPFADGVARDLIHE